jgi:hypothetical protein
MLDSTINEGYLIYVAIPNLHREGPELYTDVNEELVRLTATERRLFSTIIILHNVYHYKQIARNFKTA